MTDRPKNSFDEIRQQVLDPYLEENDMTFYDFFRQISDPNNVKFPSSPEQAERDLLDFDNLKASPDENDGTDLNSDDLEPT